MKLFEEIELRLSDEHNHLKKQADADISLPFISEEQLYSYDVALEHYKQAIQGEYDKLCPKPSEFNSYDWACINALGWICISATKPAYDGCYVYAEDITNIGRGIQIPLGLDWRLCCWSIKDAKRIHGEDE